MSEPREAVQKPAKAEKPAKPAPEVSEPKEETPKAVPTPTTSGPKKLQVTRVHFTNTYITPTDNQLDSMMLKGGPDLVGRNAKVDAMELHPVGVLVTDGSKMFLIPYNFTKSIEVSGV